MNIVSWSPFREMEDLFNRYRHFSGPLSANGGSSESSDTRANWRPIADISESKKEYVIKAELPEVDKKDLNVSVDGGRVTISGKRTMEKEEAEATQHRIESFYGTFSRSFTLPGDVDENKITAAVSNGVLKVRLPKTKQVETKPLEISIQ